MMNNKIKTGVSVPKTSYINHLALLYAGILIILAVAQLFNFEDFVPLVDSFWMPGGRVASYLLASLIVISEVFALPFLLRVQVSALMHYFSMFMSWLVPALWLYVTLWLNLSENAVSNVGLLGTAVTLPVGWWAVFASLALGILAVWCSWGLWTWRAKKPVASKVD